MGASASFENTPVVLNSDIVVLAVKPHVAQLVLKEVEPVVRDTHLILSVAMGLTLQQIQKVWEKSEKKLF